MRLILIINLLIGLNSALGWSQSNDSETITKSYDQEEREAIDQWLIKYETEEQKVIRLGLERQNSENAIRAHVRTRSPSPDLEIRQ